MTIKHRHVLKRRRSGGAFYPHYIDKEDRHFFVTVMDYFTQEEKDAMLKEEYEFD